MLLRWLSERGKPKFESLASLHIRFCQDNWFSIWSYDLAYLATLATKIEANCWQYALYNHQEIKHNLSSNKVGTGITTIEQSKTCRLVCLVTNKYLTNLSIESPWSVLSVHAFIILAIKNSPWKTFELTKEWLLNSAWTPNLQRVQLLKMAKLDRVIQSQIHLSAP